MVVTILEATLQQDQGTVLVDQYGEAAGALPPFILESFLLHAAGSDLWRIMTVWESQADLDEYRASVETPEGVRMFRAAGAEPSLMVFDVAAHAAQS